MFKYFLLPCASHLQIVLLMLSLVSTTSQAQQSLPLGIYVNEMQRDDIIKMAIKPNVDDASFLFRALVRKGLLEINPTYRRVSIEQAANEIVVTFDARKPVRMPADGSPVKWTREDGDTFLVSAAWRDGQLIQTFKSDKGQRVNVFHLSSDRQTLSVDVTLTSTQLTSPVHYEFTFKRQ